MNEEEQMITIKVGTEDFRSMLLAIGSICAGATTLKIHQDGFIDALALTDDNSSVILYTRIITINLPDIPNEVEELYIKDLNKLVKLLDMHDGEIFEFSIRNNYIYYESPYFKKGAKFMLGEHPLHAVNNKITPEWFNRFGVDCKMMLNIQDIKKLLRVTTLASSDVEKIYFYEENGELIADVNDHDKANVDCIAVSLGKLTEGSLPRQVIIKSATLARLKFGGDELLFEAAGVGQAPHMSEIMFLSYTNDNVLVKYLLNTQKS